MIFFILVFNAVLLTLMVIAYVIEKLDDAITGLVKHLWAKRRFRRTAVRVEPHF